MESIADALSLTDDPNALINTFRQNLQGASEEAKSYIFRNMKEAKTIVQEGGHKSQRIVEIVIRGMRRDEDPVKFILLRKFEKGKSSLLSNSVQS